MLFTVVSNDKKNEEIKQPLLYCQGSNHGSDLIPKLLSSIISITVVCCYEKQHESTHLFF